ncbi:hypothetical protein HYU95_02140 [Candidatus Daviesbacteria bacterium]|nr:hypothetical protein [Candidatus Daviesbacteria bacterium]
MPKQEDHPIGFDPRDLNNPTLEQRVLQSALSSVDRLAKEVPEIDRSQLLRIEELPLEEQATIFKTIGAKDTAPEQFFFELGLARKLLDTRYKDRNDPFFIDPLIHRVERGHRVVIMHEEPQGGVSRHQARFLGKVARDGVAIVVDSNHPDIQKLGINWGPQSLPLRTNQPLREIGDPPVKALSSELPVNSSGAQGAQGLFELYMQDKQHSSFKTGEEAKAAIKGMITSDYQLKTIMGTITEPPTSDNDGVMTLGQKTEIEMCNVRFIAIVGVDENLFLNRGDDEIYLHRPVRVWYNERWFSGRIYGFGVRGRIEVRCDEKVTDNEEYLQGHGLSVGRKSFDLDLSDPSTPEKRHPLQEYPLVRENNCVRYIDAQGRTILGWINGIDAARKVFQIETQVGTNQIPFDGEYEVIDTPLNNPLNESVKTGNTFKVFDPYARKDRVFEIKGYDSEHDLLIGRLVSLKPFGMSIAQVFPRDEIELLGDPKEILERYPFLKGRYKKYQSVKVRFRHEGKELTGELLTAETLPVFVEVIIEKNPLPKGFNVDHFDRYDVPVEDLLGPVEG